MSKEDQGSVGEFVRDMVGLVAGVIILIIVFITMQNFDTWRTAADTTMEATQTQAIYLYIAIPLLFPLTIFALDIASKGVITALREMILRAQPRDT